MADKNIAVWKVKKLIKSLEMARGYQDPLLSLDYETMADGAGTGPA